MGGRAKAVYRRHPQGPIPEITASIREATGDGHLDVAVITHEHQDHVNGITEKNFAGITIGQTWLAWTEKRGDRLADKLRREYEDKLLGLIAARNRLAAANEATRAQKIDEFLEFELGGDLETSDPVGRAALLAAAGDPANSANKRAMKLFRDQAADGVRFLRPHEEVFGVPGASNARVYVLGPPRDRGAVDEGRKLRLRPVPVRKAVRRAEGWSAQGR